MMSNYPYSKQLKAPMSFASVDLEKTVLSGKMNKVASFFSNQSKRFKSKIADVARKTFASFDGVEIDYYEFEPKQNHDDLLPAMIYYHGGGFMFPIQKPMMENSALYAANTGIKVFLPEYRLTLNHSCDTVLEDCYQMLKYVIEHAEELHVDRNKIFVYGDSAGGCLAAGVTLLNRDRENYPLRGQMLIYPVCDNSSERYESMEKYKYAVWSKASNEQMWRLYLRFGSSDITYQVPMKNDLHNLPCAYVEPQQYDTLRDEALAYANKMKASGIEVQVNLVSGSFHGFDADLKSILVQEVFEKRYEYIRKITA